MSNVESPIPPHNPDLPTKLYSGSCHCGKFEFEFRHPSLEDGAEVVSCNCSICVQRGYLIIYLQDPNDFKMKKGELADLTKYKFNTQTISHMFCPVCGSGVLGQGGPVVAINLRSVEGLDLDALTLKKYDGKTLM